MVLDKTPRQWRLVVGSTEYAGSAKDGGVDRVLTPGVWCW